MDCINKNLPILKYADFHPEIPVSRAKIVIQVIFTPISNISSNAIMVGSSLPVSFINPV